MIVWDHWKIVSGIFRWFVVFGLGWFGVCFVMATPYGRQLGIMVGGWGWLLVGWGVGLVACMICAVIAYVGNQIGIMTQSLERLESRLDSLVRTRIGEGEGEGDGDDKDKDDASGE